MAIQKWSVAATRYSITLLLATFAVYFKRDLRPLVFVNGRVQDASEGVVLWVKIATLFVTAIVIPLFIPRKYIPVDPKVMSFASEPSLKIAEARA